MPRSLPRKLTLEIDNREKKPLIFPKNIFVPATPGGRKRRPIEISPISIRLPTGDYRLKDYPDLCIIERKAGQDELITNLTTKDYKRFYNMLKRLSKEAQYPVLLVEATPNMLAATPKNYNNPLRGVCELDSSFMLHKLALLLSEFRVSLMLAGQSRSIAQRRNLGKFVAHLLVGTAFPSLLGISLDN